MTLFLEILRLYLTIVFNSADCHCERAALVLAEEVDSIPPLDLASRRVARQRVSEKITALRRITASFDRILGNLAAVHALPVEVMIRSFEILSEDYPPEDGYSSAEYPLGWIIVTHICRRWREIALSHTALWHKPAHKLGPQWFSEMLTRAHSTPLTIELRSYSPMSVEEFIYDALISHHDTLRVVDIYCKTANFRHKLPTFLTRAAPRLYTLKISSHLDFDIPPDLFGGDLSQLRHVSFQRVSDTWLRAPFQNIVTLEVEHMESSPLKSFDPLLNILNNNSLLESLKLTGVLPNHTAAAPHGRLIRLPRLHNITLKGSEDVSCSRLLDILEAQPNGTLCLESIQPTNDAFHRLILSISRYISHRHDKPNQLLIDIRNKGMHFDLWHKASVQHTSSLLSLDLEPPYDSLFTRYDMAPIIIRDLFSHFTLTNTCDVSVMGIHAHGHPVFDTLWQDQLPLLNKVEHLNFCNPDAIELLASSVVSEAEDASSPIFPLLHTIGFDIKAAAPFPEKNIYEMLLSVLTMRANMGFPVQKLQFWGCKCEGSELTQLLELVLEVIRGF